MSTCGCPGCEGLARRYGGDEELLVFYRGNLLIRGWAGVADELERAYQVAHAPWAQSAARVGRQNLRRGAQTPRTDVVSYRTDGRDLDPAGLDRVTSPPMTTKPPWPPSKKSRADTVGHEKGPAVLNGWHRAGQVGLSNTQHGQAAADWLGER